MLYDWRRGTFERLEPNGGWSVTLDFQDWDYRVVCPLLPGGRALFGDVARYATMGDLRIGGVAASVDSLSFDVIGMPGTAVAVHGYAAQPPHSVRAATYRSERELARASAADATARDVFCHDASGRWVVNVGLDQSGTARVTLDW